MAAVPIDGRLPWLPFPQKHSNSICNLHPSPIMASTCLLTSPRRGCPHRRGARCDQSQLQRNQKLQLEVPLALSSSRSSQVPRRPLEVGGSSRLATIDLESNLRVLCIDGAAPKRRGPKPDSKPALTRRQELNRQAQRYGNALHDCGDWH